MQLAIPQAPRRVPLSKVPGAIPRLVRVALLGWGLMAALGAGAWALGRFVVEEQAFLARAMELEGRVAALSLPPRGEREGAEAKLEVLYDVDAVRYSASG